jgi:hypothetical protein
MAQCLCEYVSTLWVGLYGHWRGYSRAAEGQQEAVFDQFNTRLVQLELQDKRCISDARRHRASGSKTLFRSKMLEHRRIQGQMAQLQRFKENAMAQFEALSNHELNRTFVRAMQGMVGANKGRVSETREDAETVMEDLQDSLSQVKDLSEFLGQPVMLSSNGDDIIDDAELESEFLEETRSTTEQPITEPIVNAERESDTRPAAITRIEDLLVLGPMLSSARTAPSAVA